MRSRLILGGGAIAAIFAGQTAFAKKSNKTESVERPNIVIIYADDMGYGDMSCQNPNSKIQTPNIDQLAADGMRFTDGHSSCGVSSPSRYALLTGNYHWRRMDNIVMAFGESEFVENEMTMPRMLSEVGYKTAMVGKWHLGWDWNSVLTDEARERIAQNPNKKSNPKYAVEDFDWSQRFRGGPVDIGFDTYYGDGTINFPPYCWIENDQVVTAPTFLVSKLNFKAMEGGGSLRQGPAATDWSPYDVLPNTAERTVKIINEHDGKEPLFVYCALSAPHAPIIPSEEFHGTSEAGFYGDFVVQCDDIVGRILSAIKEKGFEENTIVIFSADNGAERFAYERLEKFDHNSTEPLRGLKRDLWDGGHRVPFIVKWPKEIKAGEVCDELVSQIDFMATFANMTGYELPNDAATDSYDIMPVLKGEKYKKPLREAMVHNTFANAYALRQGDWVMIDNFTGSHNDTPQSYLDRYGYTEYTKDEKSVLLYNIKKDIGQMYDLSENNPKMIEQMRTILKRYQESGRSIPNRE